MRTSEFTYDLPPASIAQVPVEPRHAARLLDCRDMSDHTFAASGELLAADDLLVVNRTRVRHARLHGRRGDSGGAIELLLLRPRGDSWSALAKPSRRLRPGVVVEFGGELVATVTSEPRDGVVDVTLATTDGRSIDGAIAEVGAVPLPPYITGDLDDPERYQTIFASETASAAAPTAGLHFTPELVATLTDAGIRLAEIHLEVGLDTFRPIATDVVTDHVMHSERVTVSPDVMEAVAATRRRRGRVIAVGTTVVRALETAGDGSGGVGEFAGDTDLFITPGYEFTVVDGLVTNFHVPGSTLIVLVAAFMGERWRKAYRTAIDRGYRMLSFGDAMVAFR